MSFSDILKPKPKLKFYSLDSILDKHAQYNIIFGERSNGKTFAALKKGLTDYVEHGYEMAYLRRFREDFRGKRGQQLFEGIVNAGVVSELTGGKFTTIYYWSSRWYLANYDEKQGKMIPDSKPFAYAFAISEMEHDKSTNYENVKNIIFDEFLTRSYYLQDEFVLFMNVLSTIIRFRDDVTIFMLGNTVNKYCPYFKEMGLTNIANMKKGTIDVYSYGESKLRVAVEYAESPVKRGQTKPSDHYFAFNNPKLSMITGGAWEIAMYPHCPIKYKPKDIVFTYFIEFNDALLQCEVVMVGENNFTFIHEKTTPLQDESKDIIFTTRYDPRPNFMRNIRKPANDLARRLATYFKDDKVFYQDNEVGEIVRNYLIFCAQDGVVKN